MNDFTKNYKTENLAIMNMKKRHMDKYGSMNHPFKFYEIEDCMTIDEKVEFIDSIKNGIATYMLNLIKKWNEDLPNMSRDKYNKPRTISKKAWMKKNDVRKEIYDFVDGWEIGKYSLFGTSHQKLTIETDTTEYGHDIEYTGKHIVNQWFHDLLKKLEGKEMKYYRDNNPYEIKVKSLKEFVNTYGDLNNTELGNLKWNGKKIESEEKVDYYLKKYKQIEEFYEKTSNEIFCHVGYEYDMRKEEM